MAIQKLTDVERLILANQLQILSKLENDSSYAEVAKQLREGHEWLYLQNLHVFDNLPAKKAKFVLDVLNLYEDLIRSYEALTDKDGIEKSALVFPGFDGNHESDLLLFLGALFDEKRYLQVLENNDLNSHMPMVSIYERMLYEHELLGSPRAPFTSRQIKLILDSRASLE